MIPSLSIGPTPPGTLSKPSAVLVRQATLWSAQELSPLTPRAPIMRASDSGSPRAPATRPRATETARRMLEAYEAPPLDPTIDEVLLDFIARGKAELHDGVS